MLKDCNVVICESNTTAENKEMNWVWVFVVVVVVVFCFVFLRGVFCFVLVLLFFTVSFLANTLWAGRKRVG